MSSRIDQATLTRVRVLTLTVVGLLAAAAHGCSLLVPSDDDLRGDRSTGGKDGGGGTSGVAGGGGFPTGGSGGSAGVGGAGNPCESAAGFATTEIASPGAANAAHVDYRSTSSDLALTWLEAGDVFTRGAPLLPGAPDAPLKLSSSAKATKFDAAWSAGAARVGAVWFDTTLSFASHPPTKAAAVYGADPLLPGGKGPISAAIAGAPNSSEFAIVWRGYGDSAGRLYALLVDGGGTSLTGGDGYTRITDDSANDPECGDRNNPALSSANGGYALAWSWAPHGCDGSAGGQPDIYFTTLKSTLEAPVSKLSVAAGAGISDYPAIAAGDSDFGVAWLDDRDGKSAVWFARVAGSSVVAASLQRVSTGAPTPARAPAIAVRPGHYAVAWQEGQSIHFAEITGDGSASDAVLATDALAGDTPSLTWAGDRWVVAWSKAGSPSQLQLSICTP